jgi:DNA-binding MarR family transcriptional regulator
LNSSSKERTEKNDQKTEADKDKLLKHRKNADLKREDIQKRLNGRTLMIYFVLLNKGSTGVRELQRNLGLSSPSVARYHLDKLVDLNLVENRKGEYHLIKKADIPVLTSWILMGRFLLPRVLFIAIFFSLLFMFYLLIFYKFWNKDSFFVILFGALIVVYTWIEVILQFKQKPI